MTLYMIGLGLGNKSITYEALQVLKNCDDVLLENYTSVLNYDLKELEELTGKKINLLHRENVELNPDFLDEATKKEIAFLVVGDVFSATTHSDLFLRAIKKGLKVKILNNASILNTIGNTGLDLYKFGRTTSIVFPQENWLPKTPYDAIKNNKKIGLHTLCLLDIKVREPTKEDLRKGNDNYQKPRFMSVSEAIDVLLKLEEEHKEKVLSEDTLCVGIARIGDDDQVIRFGKLKEIKNYDFGKPLHSLIIIGKLNHFEEEILKAHQNIY